MSSSENIYTPKSLDIETNHLGVGEILKFYQYAKSFSYATVILNISPVNNVDANLSALILALIQKLYRERRVKVFVELGDGKGVFFRNGLMSHLQGHGNNNKYPDDRNSTISLNTFSVNEEESYSHYLKNDFLGHRGLDNVSASVKNILKSHYWEVFTNVGLHANTQEPVYTCGQYFPEKHILKFTLLDLGDGFLKKIFECTEGTVTDDKSAIIWATEGINTTKDKMRFGPGGTGLKELKRYCVANNGSLHICSGAGYVNMLGGKTLEYNLAEPLPGSMVSIIMRNI